MTRKRFGASWERTVNDLVARRKAFEALVAQALDDLPEEIRLRLSNVEVVIEDGAPPSGTLGLYHGIPQTERDAGYFGVLPDVITIYRLPLEARAKTREDLAREVGITVRHEIAHHFGISDERLKELGWD